MTQQPLSPAAQAVLDAITAVSPAPADEIAAAALHAAVDRVVPDTKARSSHAAVIRRIRRGFLAIAAELEGSNA